MKVQTIGTPPEVRRIMFEGCRRMSPEQKMRQVNELTKEVQQLALARIRQQYGEIAERCALYVDGGMCGFEIVMHNFKTRVGLTMALFDMLVQWHGLPPQDDGFVLLSIAEFSL